MCHKGGLWKGRKSFKGTVLDEQPLWDGACSEMLIPGHMHDVAESDFSCFQTSWELSTHELGRPLVAEHGVQEATTM